MMLPFCKAMPAVGVFGLARVEHGDGAPGDRHLPHRLRILPIEVHAVGDEVAMAVLHVDIGDRGEDSRRLRQSTGRA